MKNPEFNLEEVRRDFRYNPETGVVSRRIGETTKWRETGSRRKCGYVMIGYKMQRVLVHRLIWFLVTGSWPEALMDHVDGNPSNNRWANLRPADRSENVCNSRRKPGKFGKNVDFVSGNYYVVVKVRGKVHRFPYDTLEDAQAAAPIHRIRLHGDFAVS